MIETFPRRVVSVEKDHASSCSSQKIWQTEVSPRLKITKTIICSIHKFPRT